MITSIFSIVLVSGLLATLGVASFAATQGTKASATIQARSPGTPKVVHWHFVQEDAVAGNKSVLFTSSPRPQPQRVANVIDSRLEQRFCHSKGQAYSANDKCSIMGLDPTNSTYPKQGCQPKLAIGIIFSFKAPLAPADVCANVWHFVLAFLSLFCPEPGQVSICGPP